MEPAYPGNDKTNKDFVGKSKKGIEVAANERFLRATLQLRLIEFGLRVYS
ncbi:hypothetical protein [Salipaludibacillus neizhouensis]|nr:hypothetical protein [Salipaludibacillus neizhouensis]